MYYWPLWKITCLISCISSKSTQEGDMELPKNKSFPRVHWFLFCFICMQQHHAALWGEMISVHLHLTDSKHFTMGVEQKVGKFSRQEWRGFTSFIKKLRKLEGNLFETLFLEMGCHHQLTLQFFPHAVSITMKHQRRQTDTDIRETLKYIFHSL